MKTTKFRNDENANTMRAQADGTNTERNGEQFRQPRASPSLGLSEASTGNSGTLL